MQQIAYVIMAFGGLLSLIGVFLFARKGTSGTSKIKMFGFEFQLAGSSLVIFVLGVVLIMFPVLYAEKLPLLFAPQNGPALPGNMPGKDARAPVPIPLPGPHIPSTPVAAASKPAEATASRPIARGTPTPPVSSPSAPPPATAQEDQIRRIPADQFQLFGVNVRIVHTEAEAHNAAAIEARLRGLRAIVDVAKMWNIPPGQANTISYSSAQTRSAEALKTAIGDIRPMKLHLLGTSDDPDRIVVWLGK